MNRGKQAALLAAAAVPGALAYAAMLGLGLHRHAPAWAISLAATCTVFGPALIATSAGRREHRVALFGGVLLGWSLFLLAILPIYFPGERRQAVATGIALVGLGETWDEMAQSVAEQLPSEPDIGQPEIPEAAAMIAPEVHAPLELDEHEIALPYEGEGRRLSVPVAFEHDGLTMETQMMLDTGATYTTLPNAVLEHLDIKASPSDPIVKLHTANGEREARIVMVEKVWLGDLVIEGIAIAVCEECGSGENRGLLGLNVTGGYNLFIDADRREVVFSSRPGRDRHLDVSPFVDISASFSRYPGGRVEVVVRFDNRSRRNVERIEALVTCHERNWVVDSGKVAAGELESVRVRLPVHEPCEGYRISMDKAYW